jgi:PfaD family protein
MAQKTTDRSIYKTRQITGWWIKNSTAPKIGYEHLKKAISDVNRPIFLVDLNGELAVGKGGSIALGEETPRQWDPQSTDVYPLSAFAPPLRPQDLGNSDFKKKYDLRYAYIVGAMANAITSVRMVREVGRAGMIAFFGAGGLNLGDIEAAIEELQEDMGDQPYGFNLIHSPGNPELESGTVDLYLKKGIRRISASAYLDLTPYIVNYRIHGIHRDEKGEIVCPNDVLAKVSRVEVARKFLSPPPPKILAYLIDRKRITHEAAELAASVPVADTLTAEADSGGHTDNRPAITLLPTMLALRDELGTKYDYPHPIFIGLAGGIATPDSAAAAFAMGADYILTGSINQPCIESGTSDTVRQMLSEAMQADVTMAPSADMFEMGVKVQVLKRGTMFPLRAKKLYDLYNRYSDFEAIPDKEKLILERDIFRCRFEDEWSRTRRFFASCDPKQIPAAENDPKHKMALVFRSYLGRSSGWANQGAPDRKIDYQIWCGPALGAFNAWAKNSFLENPENRDTVTIAMNLLYGASILNRVNMLRTQGVKLPPGVERFSALRLKEINRILDG